LRSTEKTNKRKDSEEVGGNKAAIKPSERRKPGDDAAGGRGGNVVRGERRKGLYQVRGKWWYKVHYSIHGEKGKGGGEKMVAGVGGFCKSSQIAIGDNGEGVQI